MILGIDFGLKKIGLALSEGITARPIGVISNTPSRILQIKEKVNEQLETIVLGTPNSFLDIQIKEFGQQLEEAFKCTIVFQDETSSSKSALATMIQSGIPKKKRTIDDAHAAAIILQAYLDTLPNNKDTSSI